MKRGLTVTLAVIVIVVVAVSAFATAELFELSSTSPPAAAKKPFYVGVTYCGSNVTEAEELVDKVKSYTNLFVVQSGPLMDNLTEMDQICDYAVNSGLNIIVYYSRNGDANNTCSQFVNVASSRYGSHFLGLYFNDEPGGKLLDHYSNLLLKANTDISITVDSGAQYETYWNASTSTSEVLTFHNSGEIDIWASYMNFQNPNDDVNNQTMYYTNGTISFSSTPTSTESKLTTLYLWYLPNGTVIDKLDNGVAVTCYGNISRFEPYQQLWDSRPIKTYSDLADDYVYTQTHYLGTDAIGNNSCVNLFTSDYALYWFDYKAGYNTLFAELFGTSTDSPTMALAKGAADMQGKSWGAMIEWANRTTITLQTGTQIYNELRQAYRGGAQYAVVFNYEGDHVQLQNGTVIPTATGSGLLQDEQFNAIQKFWTNVVENPRETNNVTPQAAYVLPADYGWGMRSANDTIWGLWSGNATSQQIWGTMNAALSKYGSKLDIVYDDPAYSTAGRYQHVCYWNGTA